MERESHNNLTSLFGSSTKLALLMIFAAAEVEARSGSRDLLDLLDI
jgi:hypothetical protein